MLPAQHCFFKKHTVLPHSSSRLATGGPGGLSTGQLQYLGEDIARVADEKGMSVDELIDILKKDPDKLTVSKAALLDDVFGNTGSGILNIDRPKPTGTVWDDVAATAGNMPDTEIPATFQIGLDDSIPYTNPETGTNVLWTNANATEHMGEYVSRIGPDTSTAIRSQATMESYAAALNEAMADLVALPPGEYRNIRGGWEIGINTETGVVFHALML